MMPAKASFPIKYHPAGMYKGIELFRVSTVVGGVYVAWLDKFYSSPQVEALKMVIDEWWLLRRN